MQDLNTKVEDNKINKPQLMIQGAFITLTISTTLVTFCSKFIVNSISKVIASSTISTTFIGLILLLIVGNAAKYATVVTVTYKDKIALAIGVAIKSSIQIALLILPFIIVVGQIIGQDCITLYFNTFQIAVLFVTILLVNYLI